MNLERILERIAELVHDLEAYNRLYAEARVKGEDYGYYLDKIAYLTVKLEAEGIPIKVSDAQRILAKSFKEESGFL